MSEWILNCAKLHWTTFAVPGLLPGVVFQEADEVNSDPDYNTTPLSGHLSQDLGCQKYNTSTRFLSAKTGKVLCTFRLLVRIPIQPCIVYQKGDYRLPLVF